MILTDMFAGPEYEAPTSKGIQELVSALNESGRTFECPEGIVKQQKMMRN